MIVEELGNVRAGGELLLSLQEREGRHRCVIAEKPFQRGDIVVLETPYAMITPAMFSAVTCCRCGYSPDANKGEQIYGVAAADPIRYCSQECLQADSTIHLLEANAVQALAALSIEGSTESIRLIIRMAALKRQEVLNLKLNLGEPQFPSWGDNNLFAHVMCLDAPTASMDPEALQDIEMVAQVVETLLSDNGIPLSEEEVNHLLLAIQSNAHRVVDVEKKCVGLGAFPFISMLNHSCDPNCSHNFEITKGQPPKLVMKAIADIAVGDELCYNYIPLYQSTDRRRAQLESAYSFTCDCKRCTEASVKRDISTDLSGTVFNMTSSSFLFPQDHVLSDVIISKEDGCDSAKSNEARALDFSSIIPCEGKVLQAISTEITMCNSLLSKAASNMKACKSVTNKLLKFFNTKSKAGSLHPCHELILSAYVTCAKVCEMLLSRNASESAAEKNNTSTLLDSHDVILFSQAALGLGGLALGCIIKYTHVRNNDVADLEKVVGIGLQGYVQDKEGSQIGDFHNSDEFTTSFVRVASDALSSLGYVWAGESVVSNILACACRYASESCAKSNSVPLSYHFLESSKISNTSC